LPYQIKRRNNKEMDFKLLQIKTAKAFLITYFVASNLLNPMGTTLIKALLSLKII
jgi:hypothetical protein